ncbi:MAG: 16S rRNA (adenine(1518)-N(6)/adenine(1519)-N(6))-dimethyltransferase RsmA [Chloroherpetonaceae bacterium]|nr:16S rRNA (adenine(1518)-N(6)/adenine(1519)-N(6))-dimethyltransferase RsmA [Chloroherpetonaceae bacterium]MDW8437595.1 16S rRNA (adenine(1518)-N(6)/adenine(1519)-N(6))-dimethyltransferase RsmA [Chloroherpetonaceae bacterium]
MKVKYKDAEVAPKKRFGQNFLLDQNVLRKIVAEAHLSPDDNVLEIGSGFGALTRHIAAVAPRFVAVELDRNLAAFIRSEFPDARLIEGDFLDVPLAPLAKEKPLKILGNIPYSITTPILFKLLDERAFVESAILLVQDEVARRLSAKPREKDYGVLAVQLQAFAKTEYLFKVSKNVFKPQPTVNSAAIRLSFRQGSSQVPSELEGAFRALVRRAFAMRRKTLENNLKFHYDLSGVDFDFKRRAEELSIQDFVALTRRLSERERRAKD